MNLVDLFSEIDSCADEVFLDSIQRKNIISFGNEIDISSDVWYIPYFEKFKKLNFARIHNVELKSHIKEYIIFLLEHTSHHAGIVNFAEINRYVTSRIARNILFLDLKEHLIQIIEDVISLSAQENKLYQVYRVIQWYIWSSKNIKSDLFSEEYAHLLEIKKIPGNVKGESVKNMDDKFGPLTELEFTSIVDALKNDTDVNTSAIQQRAYLALLIAFGRNVSNHILLKNCDLEIYSNDNAEFTYLIKIPRIKKRLINPRDELQVEYLDSYLAGFIIDLIEENKKKLYNRIDISEERLFVKRNKLRSNCDKFVSLDPNDFNKLLKNFVIRNRIFSSRTNNLLNISTRRMRQTYATRLVMQGITAAGLARGLDHSDTQHVKVYFDTRHLIVKHLDNAVSKKFAKIINLFKGNIISKENQNAQNEKIPYYNNEPKRDGEIIGECGKSSICHLDPPFSCYLCPKFIAYDDISIHENILSSLTQNRNKRIEENEYDRLAVQFDDVIIAVANVINKCNEKLLNEKK